ncbi:MAG: hypothetical protein AB7I19_12590 [Planctomycetota bacterium]
MDVVARSPQEVTNGIDRFTLLAAANAGLALLGPALDNPEHAM